MHGYTQLPDLVREHRYNWAQQGLHENIDGKRAILLLLSNCWAIIEAAAAAAAAVATGSQRATNNNSCVNLLSEQKREQCWEEFECPEMSSSTKGEAKKAFLPGAR